MIQNWTQRLGMAVASLLLPSILAGNGVRYDTRRMMGDEGMKIAEYPNPFCTGSACYSQNECCPGAVCMTHRNSKQGVCVRKGGQLEGKVCEVGSVLTSCAEDLVCSPIHRTLLPIGFCLNPNRILPQKNYWEGCSSTMECDTALELCCRLQDPSPRQTQTKKCSYYDDLLKDCIF